MVIIVGRATLNNNEWAMVIFNLLDDQVVIRGSLCPGSGWFEVRWVFCLKMVVYLRKRVYELFKMMPDMKYN